MLLHELTIVANHSPEVLERILRVIRLRGYTVTQLTMKLENGKVWLDIYTTSKREIHLLLNQLAKLHDVVDVSCD
ncbi:acetolactate synthase 2 small subunit [Lonepinella koalarum]|uniref:Acetolactate synthase small subunit n=1 Tax=Lonepinella koalarum TaxID=53417 RepID=A0A4R1KZS4_9PAST|nr:acetolactate synthase 2 small subunit [Lonepinella koalarum]MDH2925951.1 acetolactate synthase [Lonepinella koalarum]TCK71102.1 acetolactate synthase small subunit [Lonepinella koalarum]TFJ90831.1 acetolactate synthase 2 small subunit [Lonepinella koalarum]TYG34617.1 acetolactate synthase 2 small subunit [Lonepinella koalarum]